MGNAVAISAGGHPYDAIRIAQAFIQARGGRIATLPDLFRLYQVQPTHPIFNSFMLADSVLATGYVRGRRGRRGYAHVVHGSGFLLHPKLGTWREETREVRKRKLRPHMSDASSGIMIPTKYWNQLRLHTEAVSVPLRRVQPSHIGPSLDREVVIDTQMRALMGDSCATLVESRRSSTKEPPEEASADKYHFWRRGSIGTSVQWHYPVSLADLRQGHYAMAMPLQLLVPKRDTDELIVCDWKGFSTQVLAVTNDWQPSDPIQLDPKHLFNWLLAGQDAFHSTEPAMSTAEGLGFVVASHPEKTELFLYAPQINEDGSVESGAWPRCRVEIDEVLGEVVIASYIEGAPLNSNDWRMVLERMPPGTEAIQICSSMEDWDKQTLFTATEEDLKATVKFVKLRPLQERRFLTPQELFADPNEYLRRIGVGL